MKLFAEHANTRKVELRLTGGKNNTLCVFVKNMFILIPNRLKFYLKTKIVICIKRNNWNNLNQLLIFKL